MSTVDLAIYVGDTYEHQITWTHDDEVVPLTGWTGVAVIKKFPGSPVLTTFTVTKPDAENGVFKIALSAAQTAALADAFQAVWDVQFTHTDGRVATPAHGSVVITRDVSP